MPTAHADPVRRAWILGLIVYLVIGLVLDVLGGIMIPWLGLTVMLACNSVGGGRRAIDERLIMVAASMEFVLGILVFVLVTRRSVAVYDRAFTVAFYVAALIPLAIAAYELTRPKSAD